MYYSNMIKSKSFLISFIVNILYGLVLLNIASAIIFESNFFSISYEFALMIVVAYFVVELFMFFTNIPSPGILILSIVSIIPFIFLKRIKITQVTYLPRLLKWYIAYFSFCIDSEVSENDHFY